MSGPEREPGNPFVGPVPLRSDNLLHGRDRELTQLTDLLLADRIVLLYSPSGAGKTSLIHAKSGLVDRLKREEEDARILPVIRVGLEFSPSRGGDSLSPFNRYVFSALHSLEADTREGDREPFDRLLRMRLEEHPLLRRADPHDQTPRVLIFDQFEEIFTLDPTDLAEKDEFFRQVGAVLKDRLVWALFSMREEHIAGLDAYRDRIPTRFGNTFRLELLGERAARQVILGSGAFEDEAAAKLVDDLRTVTIQLPGNQTGTRLGPYVEPVQLQVVCCRLWDHWRALRDRGPLIRVEDVGSFGDVGRALSDYYAETVNGVAGADNALNRAIREWFDQELIVGGRFRAQVLRETVLKPGVDDTVLRRLVDAHLVREDQKRGATWYELAHDRLIEPVRSSNAAWLRENLSMLQRQAELWKSSGKPNDLLLRGSALAEAETVSGPRSPLEVEFLEASRTVHTIFELERRAREEEQRQERLKEELENARRLATEKEARLLAEEAARIAAEERTRETEARLASERQAREVREEAAKRLRIRAIWLTVCLVSAVTAIALAASYYFEVGDARRMERSRELTLLSSGLKDREPDTSLLLGLEAVRFRATMHAQKVLWNGLRSRFRAFLRGHEDLVNSVAVSPDGRLAASGSNDGTVIVWDLTTRRPRYKPLKEHRDRVLGVAFSPDGARLASSSGDKTVILWDVATGKPLGAPLSGHASWVGSVAFSPDGKKLASGGGDSQVVLWELSSGNKTVLSGHEESVSSVAFNHDGTRLASGSSDRTVLLWDVATGMPVGQPLWHSSWVGCVAFSPDGRVLASGSCGKLSRSQSCESGEILLWDAATGRLLPDQPSCPHRDRVTGVAFSPDGTLFASGSGDKTIQLWDAKAWTPLGPSLAGHDGWVTSVAFTSDGSMVSGSWDRTLILWDAVDKEDQPVDPGGPETPVRCIALSRDGTLLAVGGCGLPDQENPENCLGGEIRLYRMESPPSLYRTLKGHSDWVSSLSFGPDGKSLVSGSYDRTIIQWDVDTGRPVGEPLRGHQNLVTSVAVSGDGKTLASWGNDQRLLLWDLEGSGKSRKLPLARADRVCSLAFSPDGETLAAGFAEGSIALWGVREGNEKGRSASNAGRVLCVVYSPDGETLASGGQDGTIALWKADGPRLVGRLTGFASGVLGLAFLSDGRSHLVSGHDDKTVILWDVRNRAMLDQSSWPGGKLLHLKFGPGGRTMASVSDCNRLSARTIFLAPKVDLEAWRARVCGRVGRPLTKDEWERYFRGEDYRESCPPSP